MKWLLLTTLGILPLLTSCKKETIEKNLIKSHSLNSKETGNCYEITVQLPEDYGISMATFPTLYVLDARQDDTFVGAQCSKISKSLGTKNILVVGIRYKNKNGRSIDYTPTKTSYGSGGANSFAGFVENELIPFIESKYHADRQRSGRLILGHSFGGLFGAYAFIEHPDIFGNYLLLSPSLFYDNSALLKAEEKKRNSLKDTGNLIYIGIGGAENDLLPANDLLQQRIKAYYTKTKLGYQILEGKEHMSSKDINIKNALTFYFKNR